MIINKLSLLYSIGFLTKYTKADLSTLNGLVCYYRGDSLQDSSAAGNDLMAVGSGPHYETITSAPFASASRDVYLLNGSGYQSFYLKASVPSLPVGNSPRTMMGWLRIDQASTGPSGWIGVFTYGQPYSNNAFQFMAFHSGFLAIDVWGTNLETNNGKIEDTYGDFGVWRHIATTFDGTNLLVYINGVETYTGTVTSPMQTLLTDFSIGTFLWDRSDLFYAAVAEVAIFDRALTQQEITNVVNGDTAGGGGDPHMFGFGGVYFTWQGHCDIILTMAPKQSDTHPDVHIHARTQRIRDWSVIDSIAFKVGDDIGEIESDQGTLLVNGNNVKSYHSDTLSVTFSKLTRKIVQYEVVFNKDKVLVARVNPRMKMVFVTLNGNYNEGTVGVLGSPHKPGMFARNGTEMTGEDINQFVESWQTTANDPKLFQKDRDPQYPTKCLYKMSEIKARMRSRQLKEIHTTTIEEANTACDGHPAGPLKNFCVEDMVNTGDFETAADVFYG